MGARAGEERWTIYVCRGCGFASALKEDYAGRGNEACKAASGYIYHDPTHLEPIEVMPVSSDHQPARLGPEPKVEASSKQPLVVALEREELEALVEMVRFGIGSTVLDDSVLPKLHVALSEPRGGA